MFDSNRGGTFGIYRLDTASGAIEPVIDGPHHEMVPRPSPDGEWIAYAVVDTLERGRNRDVRMCRLDGSDDRLVLTNANHAAFVRDGTHLMVERSRSEVWTVPLDGGEAVMLYRPSGTVLSGAQLIKPEPSPDENWIAFIADRPRDWHAWVVNLPSGETSIVGRGCEPVWHPSGTSGYWVRAIGSRERTGIWHYDGLTGEKSVIQDADAPRGHEYFPWVSADAKVLLWASCRAGEHAHEDANYQLFGKMLDGGEAVRLTFDRFTNRWPRGMP